MNVILIEDEGIALRKLKKIISEIAPETVFLAELESVTDAGKWFQNNRDAPVDLIFSDIQLSDGLSFEIFETLNTQLPIIFTTAYNEYALRAFKLNGVDYLLKPIQKDELQKALNKFAQTRTSYSNYQLLQFCLPRQSLPLHFFCHRRLATSGLQRTSISSSQCSGNSILSTWTRLIPTSS